MFFGFHPIHVFITHMSNASLYYDKMVVVPAQNAYTHTHTYLTFHLDCCCKITRLAKPCNLLYITYHATAKKKKGRLKLSNNYVQGINNTASRKV